MDMGFFLQKECIFQVPIKLAQPPAPELRAKNFYGHEDFSEIENIAICNLHFEGLRVGVVRASSELASLPEPIKEKTSQTCLGP